jgi:hypothetical protein
LEVQLLLRLIQQWIWRDAGRQAYKLLSFAETEADGGRDLARAAERTADPVLRRLYLIHAADEFRHADVFRSRGIALLQEAPANDREPILVTALAPGERGLDDLHVEREKDEALLAFLHLSERTAAIRFGQYRDALPSDSPTRKVFERVLRDETFHMTYTGEQLTRIAPNRRGLVLWRARLGRLWKAYLRLAMALAGVLGSIVLTAIYFVILSPFALLMRRAARRETNGWNQIAATGAATPKGEY